MELLFRLVFLQDHNKLQISNLRMLFPSRLELISETKTTKESWTRSLQKTQPFHAQKLKVIVIEEPEMLKF